jgi:methyl-accepting chemotaxis protein
MSEHRILFFKISALLLLQNGLLAASAAHLSPGLSMAMMATLVAGVIILSMTTAMMATRIAGSSEEAQPVAPKPEQYKNSADASRCARETPTLRLRSVSTDPERSQPGKNGVKPVPAEMERLEAAESALSVLDAGLRRVAAGDLSTRIEAPFAERFEGLRGDFNRTIGALDDSMGAITITASTLHGECAEARLRLLQERSTLAEEAPALSAAGASLKEVATDLRRQEGALEDASALACSARLWVGRGREVSAASAKAIDELAGTGGKLGSLAAAMREVAFRMNILSVSANVAAANVSAPQEALKGFASELRVLAEDGADAAKRASVLERDVAPLATETASSLVRLAREGQAIGSGLEALEGKLLETAEASRRSAEIVAQTNAGLSEAAKAVTRRRTLDRSVETVLERMTRELTAIHRHCERFIPVITLSHGNTPPDGDTPRPRSHLRLVKT